MNERLPIKFFSKREEDSQRKEGGGKKDLPRFVLSGERLRNKSMELSQMLSAAIDESWENRDVPVIIEAKINEEAQAKTHRKKIETLFFTDKNNVIGGLGKNTLIVRIDSREDGVRIKNSINDSTKNAYGISCIESINRYKPYLHDFQAGYNYKVKLFNFNEDSSNLENKRKFEKLLKDKDIEFTRSNYSKNLIIYKLIGVSSLEVNRIVNDTLFDLVEAIVTMPTISISLDELIDKDAISVKKYDDNKKSEIVGVLDNGVANIPHLQPWIYGIRHSPYPTESVAETHGTFVAGIVIYGDELQGREVVGADNIRVFDAAIFPDTNKEHIDEDELIENIREVIKRNCKEIKIWNLSISITNEISEEKFSDFAVALDEIQDEYDVLICKSAGNCLNFVHEDSAGRLCEGADSVRSLVVGSIAAEKPDGCLANPNNLSPFSRIGPGPAYIIKPDIVHFGGNAGVNSNGRIIQKGVKSFSRNGDVIELAGTSYSTPRVASLAAALLNEMDEEFDSLLLKSLIIHSASYPENTEIEEDKRTKYLGFGLPDTIHNILYNNQNEITLILRDRLSKGGFIDIKDFPIPDSLIKDNYFDFQITVTLVYNPILDPTQGFEYCQSNIDVKFGSYDEKISRDTSRSSILNPIGRKGAQNILKRSLYSKRKIKDNSGDFALKERMLIQYGDKYYPVKKYAVDTTELTDKNKDKYANSRKKWYLTIDNTYRNYIEEKAMSENTGLSQEFCLIITIKDASGLRNVYDGVTQKLDAYNFWHSNIKISEHINVIL